MTDLLLALALVAGFLVAVVFLIWAGSKDS